MPIHFIKRNQHIRVDCYRELNLLGHAQLEELHLGSRCGGQGVCGRDRVWIPLDQKELFSPVTEAEREHLTAREIEQGCRLACQCWPNTSEMSVEIRVENTTAN